MKVNGREVTPFAIPVGRPSEGKPSFEKFEQKGVIVRILATVAHADARGQLAFEPAGWYIACNGRLVLSGDKSEKTGWNISPMPQFHSKYRAFIGFVFFESENPLLLPWTTTKRGLNKESEIYLYVRRRMALAARPVISFCNRKYGADPDEQPVEREISKEVSRADFSELTSHKQTVFSVARPTKPKSRTTTRVQYDAENSDLEKIRKHLRKIRMGASSIGKHTFQYFLRQEGLK